MNLWRKLPAFGILIGVAWSLAPGSADAATAWSDNHVDFVRSYADGRLHIGFTQSFACEGGNQNILIVDGVGADRVLSTALAADLSGRSVTLEYDTEQKLGSYCMLGYIRLNSK